MVGIGQCDLADGEWAYQFGRRSRGHGHGQWHGGVYGRREPLRGFAAGIDYRHGAAGPTFRGDGKRLAGEPDVSPASLSALQTAVTGRFNVITGDSCNWSSFSDVSWLHITTATTGTGNGGLGYSIDANTGASRVGSIHVGAQLFTVTQAGVAAPTVQLTVGGKCGELCQRNGGAGRDCGAVRQQSGAIHWRATAIEREQDGDYEFTGRSAGPV